MKRSIRSRLAPICALAMAFFGDAFAGAARPDQLFQIGAAQIDITPSGPIRLSGYAVRKSESEGVEAPIFAKALAIGNGDREFAILVSVDNVGVPAHVTDEVAARLNRKTGLPPERFALCSSHTHAAPCLSGALSNLFAMKLPEEQQARIERYTGELTDRLERVALEALGARRPGYLAWGAGTAGFAQNRRTPGGPTDHSVPVLRASSIDGQLIAVVANYACHCTTLRGDFNKVCGDWAGFAQSEFQQSHRGAVALITIGCGADANPSPRGTLAHAKQYGHEIAAEAARIVGQNLAPITHPLTCRLKRFDLPFDPLPTRERWMERAKESGIVGFHAQQNLARLDRGETLPTRLPYRVQVWNFGDDLAMVFLAGEVVVDYEVRLKQELDATRLWINGYANDVPCYIPSRRILKEGGYEAETSLWYYDRPARLAPTIEDLIDEAVLELVPKAFRSDREKAESPPPRNAEKSPPSLRAKAAQTVELVAAEPLVVDPGAIDIEADGKANVVKTIFTGFTTDNVQAGVNRLSYSVDDRVDGATSLSLMPEGAEPSLSLRRHTDLIAFLQSAPAASVQAAAKP